MDSPLVKPRNAWGVARASLQQHWQTHQRFWAIAAVFAVARALAGLYLRPGGYLTDLAPDARVYHEMLRLNYGGLAPFLDYWLEYPPLFPWILQGIGALSLRVPPLYDALYVPNSLLRLVLTAFDVGNLALVYAGAVRIWGLDRGLITAAAWALAFTPLVTFLGWYEPLALFFMLLALFAIVEDRPTVAGLAIGLGFCVKVFPAVLAPLALLGARTWRQRALVVTIAAAVVIGVFGPLYLQNPVYVEAWFVNLISRSSWETIWAFLNGYMGFGAVATLNSRNDPLTARIADPPGQWPGVVITLITAAFFVWVATRRIDWKNNQFRACFALFSMLLFLLISKGFSPQWHAYLVALVLVALPLRSAVPYVIALDVLLMAEFPFALDIFQDHPWVIVGVVILRTGLMVAIAVEALARLWPDLPPARMIARGALPVALGLLAVIGLGAVPSLARSYSAGRLAAEPLLPVIESNRGDQANSVIVTQAIVYERLTPYLPAQSLLYLPNGQGTAWRDVATWTEQALAGRDRIWLVFAARNRNEADQTLHDQVRTQVETWGCPVVRTWLETEWVGQYVRRPVAPRVARGVVFTNGADLRSITLPDAATTGGSALCVELDWSAQAPLDRDYTIFVHLLGAGGQLIAQSDLAPDTGTSGWAIGERYLTRHGLVLPAAAGAGPFTLAVGLYEAATGSRVAPVAGGDAFIINP